MKLIDVVYHEPTGLWWVCDEHGHLLVAFTTKKIAEQFARYGSVSIYDLA